MNDDVRSETWTSRARLVLLGFAVIGGFLLLAEHRAHVLPYLPFLLLAACPLMHVFMHRGHGHGGHTEGRQERPDGEANVHARGHGRKRP
jgi:hypothetical protein